MRHAPTALILSTLALTLAACSHSTPPSPVAAQNLVRLSLSSPLARVAAQGLPGAGGVGPVNHLKVKVYDAQRSPVTFDGGNVYQQGGAQAFLTLSAEQPSIDVLLPQGTYSFENIGTAGAGGAFLAYGWNADQDLSGAKPSVNLELHTLLDPDTLSLNTYLPTKYAFTQDVLDLRLQVQTPNAGDGRLPVPLNDYQVTYAAPLGEVLGSSKLGARVKVIGQTGAASIDTTATVSGYVADGAESARWRSVPVTRSVAVAGTTLHADLGAPTVTVDELAAGAVGVAQTLSGAASDAESGIAAVRVFDGAAMIGSTDEADGVPPVTFTLDADQNLTSDWTLEWTPELEGSHDLTVIATDTRGNESRAPLNVSVTIQPD